MNIEGPPRLSILTPTFNRAHTLPRTYAALVAQTVRPHEWIVVDDGSTDGTGATVAEWARVAPFPIRYVRQENLGKPAAHNAGVAAASGDLLAVLDSDDWCESHALQRLVELWLEIPAERRDQFTGVTVHCADEAGQLIGQPFPASPMDSTLQVMWARRWCVGDKWGFHRLDILRRFPFPLIPGERFVPESLVWNRIGRSYLMRFVNETLGRKEYQPDGLTRRWLRTMAGSALGALLYYGELAVDSQGIVTRIFALTNAARFGRHAGQSVPSPDLRCRYPVLSRVAAMASWCVWRADRFRLERGRATVPHSTTSSSVSPTS